MKSHLLTFFLFLMVGSALAQQPGPESKNTNRNTPAVSVPQGTNPSAPPNSDKSPAAPVANTKPAPEPGAIESATAPTQPTTEILPAANANPSADATLEPTELPSKPLSLIGGTAVRVDQIRNRVEIAPFGGGKKINVRFDDRSHIYRDGRETTVMAIHKNDRVYVDTMLVDGRVFAKNIRVASQSKPAEATGQVTAFDPRSGRITLRDNLTGQPVSFTVSSGTSIQLRDNPATVADIKPGALMDVMFAAGPQGGTANQVKIYAVPGEKFVFAGRITSLDLSRGIVALDNESDQKNYEVHFNPAVVQDRGSLKVGREVVAQATFDGRSYMASQLSLAHSQAAEQ